MYKYSIPVPPDNFSGRKRELSKLIEYFDTQKIIIIAGITGIGKTSLILRFLQEIEKIHINKQLVWIDVSEGITLETFFSQINKWLMDRGHDFFDKVNKNKKEDSRSKIDALINGIEINDIVLAIDNFHEIENDDTRYLIKQAIKFFSKGRLLISTRKRVKLSPIERVDIFERRLNGLSYDDSLELIHNLMEKHGYDMPSQQTLKNIYGKIQGHPFSIKLLVSLYITGDISLDELVLESSQFGDELENYILDSLFRTLSKKEKTFLTHFSAFNIPVSQKMIEDLIDISNFNSVKNKLVELYLFEMNKDKKYFIHSILKNYCLSKLKKKEKMDLYARFAEYFSKYDDLNFKLQAFYYWFDTEEKDKAIEFLITFIKDMFKQGKNEELLTIIENILKSHEDKYPILSFFKANIYLRWGRLSEAIEVLDELTGKVKDKNLKANIYETYGRSYALISENSIALEYFEKSLELYKELDNKEGICSSLIGIGDTYRFMSQYDKTIEFFNQAKEYQNMVSLELKGRILKGFGDISLNHRDYNSAISYYEKAISIFSEIQENFYIGKIKHNLSLLYFELGEPDKCISLLNELLEYRKSINDTVGLVYNYSFLGELYLLEDDNEKSEVHLREGLKYIQETDEKRGQIDLYLNLIRLYIVKKEYGSARNILREAREAIEDFEGVEKLSLMLDIAEYMIEFFDDKNFELEELKETRLELEKQSEITWALQALFIERNLAFKNDDKFEPVKNFEELKEKVIPNELKFFERLFKLSEDSKKIYTAILNDDSKMLSALEYKDLENERDKFDLWIDLSKNEIIEKKKGEIKVLKKRTVANVFMFFLNNPGRELSFKEIFENIWKREYDPETDAITVRVNISRLRQAVEPNPKTPKYIINAKESGFYLFNPKNSFALIKKA